MFIHFRKSYIDVPSDPRKDKICLQDKSWRKTIMIGSDYQATIPNLEAYNDTLPYGENI